MDNKFEDRLFNCFNSFTVVLYWLAILYKLSPLFTMYVFVPDGVGVAVFVGNTSVCPILSVLDVKLLIFFSSFTVVLNFLAILHKLSPFWTV